MPEIHSCTSALSTTVTPTTPFINSTYLSPINTTGVITDTSSDYPIDTSQDAIVDNFLDSLTSVGQQGSQYDDEITAQDKHRVAKVLGNAGWIATTDYLPAAIIVLKWTISLSLAFGPPTAMMGWKSMKRLTNYYAGQKIYPKKSSFHKDLRITLGLINKFIEVKFPSVRTAAKGLISKVNYQFDDGTSVTEMAKNTTNAVLTSIRAGREISGLYKEDIILEATKEGYVIRIDVKGRQKGVPFKYKKRIPVPRDLELKLVENLPNQKAIGEVAKYTTEDADATESLW
jgi:hypothetical protein